MTSSSRPKMTGSGSEPSMFAQRPSAGKCQDISHILTRIFRDEYAKDAIDQDTVRNLTTSKSGRSGYHSQYVEKLQEVGTRLLQLLLQYEICHLIFFLKFFSLPSSTCSRLKYSAPRRYSIFHIFQGTHRHRCQVSYACIYDRMSEGVPIHCQISQLPCSHPHPASDVAVPLCSLSVCVSDFHSLVYLVSKLLLSIKGLCIC